MAFMLTNRIALANQGDNGFGTVCKSIKLQHRNGMKVAFAVVFGTKVSCILKQMEDSLECHPARNYKKSP